MKREGKQHGVVRSSSKQAAGSSSDIAVRCCKAPAKPTGHSRHTGKCRTARCGQCHSHPVSKSRDTAKGTHKLRSSDVVLNHRPVSWRVVADRNAHWSKYSGVSATGVLDALLTDSCWSQGDDDSHEEQDHYDYGEGFDEPKIDLVTECSGVEESCVDDIEATATAEEEEEDMGFYEVGFVWEYVNEEGWCVVDEM